MSKKAFELAVYLTAYDRMTRVINDAAMKAEKRIKDMKKTSQEAFGKGTALLAAGVATAAPIVEATKTAIAFEDAMADVAKVMDLTVGSGDFLKMGQQARDLGVHLGITGTESAKLMANLAAGGVAKEDIAEVGKIAGEMGVAFSMTAGEAGTAFVKIKNALNQSTEETKTLMDAVNYLSDSMASEANEIVNYMASGGSSVAASFGIAGEASAAFGSTLISVGKSSSEAATIMERFSKGVMKNDDLRGIFEGAGGGAAGLMAVLEEGNKAGDRFEFFQKFGEYGTDVSMLAKNINLLQGAIAGSSDKTKTANSVSKEFANRQSTTQGQINKLSATFDALKVNLGSVFLPALNKVVSALNKAGSFVAKWAEENPRLAKTIGMVTAAVSGVLLLAGAFFIVKGAVLALNVVMAMNPFILIAMAAVAAVAVIVTNWDLIKGFFIRLWASVKQIFVSTWQWIKNLLLNFTPVGLIIKHWSTLVAWFQELWAKVKEKFNDAVSWIMNLGTKMLEAGRNLVNSIWEGMKAAWGNLEAWFEKKVQRIREFLPFSPAKRGPLRDIHRLKFVETIAQSIKPEPLMRAMNNVAGVMAGGAGGMLQPAAAGGGGMSINYSPTITVNGGGPGAQQEFSTLLQKHKNEIGRMIESYQSRKERLAF
jgi:TP901 family phage tail tape measure protein